MIRPAVFRRFLCSNVLLRKNFFQIRRQMSFISPKNDFCKKSLFTIKFSRFASDFPPHKIAKLPNLSPTMETGTIQTWSKNEGDRLEEGDVLCQVETDKAVMAMETPYPGFLAKIIYPSGTKNIAVGQAIAIIVKKSEEIPAFKDYTPSAESKPSVAVKDIPVTKSTSDVKTKEGPSKSSLTGKHEPTDGRVLATPYAKNLAKTAQIDISTLAGSGPDGLILARDVSSTKPVKKSTQTQKTKDSSYTDIELTSMRSTIAKRLALSHSTIPHFYVCIDVEMDKLISLRADINKQMGDKIKISINDFIIKASSLALLKVPECNSQWHDSFIRKFHTTDISVAVSTDTGLITPIIFDASSKSISCISQEMKILADKAKKNQLTLAEFQGGTFTISNLGMFGISDFTAIINQPQSCILSVGCISQRYAQGSSDSQPIFKNYMRVTLGCDHRVVDGAVGATWLKSFKEILEAPYSILV